MKFCNQYVKSLVFIASLTLIANWADAQAAYTNTQPGKFMRRWLVLGPIPVDQENEERGSDTVAKNKFQADLLADAGGERGVEPAQGDGLTFGEHHLTWKFVQSDKDAVDLEDVYGEKERTIVYAAATVTSSSDATELLGIGSDDAVRVWINGELVHENWTVRPVSKDDDVAAVKLKEGENRLLVKIYNGRSDWGFVCRFLSLEAQVERLVRAAGSGNQDDVDVLLAHGVDINAKSKYGITAVQAARMRGYKHTADYLQSKGAAADLEFSVDEFIDSVIGNAASDDQPGAAVLVSRGGTVVYSKGFGIADLSHDVPVTTKTKFRIGSVTKQFVACAILKLQEDGKLSVDDSLDEFIPDYPRGDEVKIHHLLTHTSGIHSFTSKSDFFSSVASEITPEDMIKSFKNDPYDFSPGEKWSYNNSGYFLLGHIIAKVSGKSLDEYLKHEFFEPLGMHNTGVHTSSVILKHEATGYSYSTKGTKKALDWDMSQAGGAGNLYSTVEDLQRWNEGIFGGKLLSDESLTAAFTPVELKGDSGAMPPYGYGWIIDTHRGLRRISHNGGLNGFLSGLVRFPDQEVTVAVLHNASPPVPGLVPGAVVSNLVDAFLWQEMDPRPRYEVAEGVDPATYDAYLGRYDYGAAVLTVTKEDDRLFAQMTGQAKYEIFPAGGTKFFWNVVEAQVEFLLDDNGQATSARHSQGGATFTASKINEESIVKVANEVLDLYVGKYSYKGLGVLTVRRKGNRLLAQMTDQPAYEIFPKSQDEFFWRVVKADIKFAKGADGKVEKAIHQQGGATIEARKIE